MSDSAAASEQVLRIENIQKYTQRYVDGTLVITPIEIEKAPEPEPEPEPEPIIKELKLHSKNLTELPELPKTLIQLWCGKNKLTKLPEKLPDDLEELICYQNELTELPEKLPEKLKVLYCSENKLKKLPEHLPESLIHIYCFQNNLTKLPEKMPPNLEKLGCQNNELTILPDLPETLRYLNLLRNKLETNYPQINKFGYTPDLVKYINQRNREMREMCEMREKSIMVDESYVIKNTHLNMVYCSVKHNGILIANSQNNINNVLTNIYGAIGIKNAEFISSISISNVINSVKAIKNMSMDLIMIDPNTALRFRYVYDNNDAV